MQVKNKYVKIKIGNKEIDFNNLILDTYLRRMVEGQSSFDSEFWQSPELRYCYVKYDSKLDFDETSVLHPTDFNNYFDTTKIKIKHTTNEIEVEYRYSSLRHSQADYDKKITALGFFDSNSQDAICYACLDLSNYGLYYKSSEDLTIVRVDSLSTKATFTTNNNIIDYPLHLSPRMHKVGYLNYYNLTAYLSSVGLGTNARIMRKEIELDENNTIYFGNKIIFHDILSNENILDILEPNIRQPQNRLYPTDTANNYTYLFLKFKIYRNKFIFEETRWEHIDTGNWYTLSVPINVTGDFNYAITYERSDDNGI